MRRASSGFTLVEILVGLTLMSLILSTLFSGLYGASRSWSHGESVAAESDLARVGIGLLRRLVSELVPVTRLDGQAPRLMFDGQPDALRWVAPLPSHAGGSGLYWATLRVAHTSDGESQLVLSYSPLRPDTDPALAAAASEAESVVLAPGISHLEIAYFGTLEQDLPPRWEERWESEDRLPTLIRIALSRPPGDHVYPDLFIPVRSPPQRGQVQWMLYAPPTPAG